MTTTNLAEFGRHQLKEVGEMLIAYANKQYEHPFFTNNGVHAVLNKNSGFVFLTDDDYNVLMLNSKDELEGWYNLPYSGEEGFFSDLIDLYQDDWDDDDKEYLVWIAKGLNRANELPEELIEEFINL